MYERSYHNRVLKEEAAPKAKQRRRIGWKGMLSIVVVLLFLAGAFFALRAPSLQVTSIEIEGTSVLDTEDISIALLKQLQGKSLWFFPRTSVLLVNTAHLEKALKAEFSRIETVTVSRASLHSLAVSIKEFDAVYLWCADSENDCYFMDKQGMVYSRAPVFSGTAYPRILTGVPLENLPFQAMSVEDVSRIATLEKGLSDINITPTLFKNVSDREMEIAFLHNKSRSVLRIDPSIDTATTLEYVYSGIRAEPLASLFHDSQKALLYLDVRFSNKVVYKFE